MLSSAQWEWLEEELAKEAEITVIVSGVQVVVILTAGKKKVTAVIVKVMTDVISCM